MGTNWQSLSSVQKGNIGEKLVNEWLGKQGFIPYSPTIPGVHPFDKLVASADKKRIFIAEIKTKPARTYYPDTGINIRNYEDYKFIEEKHKLDVFLFFVDEDKCKIYGNWLKELEVKTFIKGYSHETEYPLRQGGIIYFPLKLMKEIADISPSEIEQLKALSGRNKDYIR